MQTDKGAVNVSQTQSQSQLLSDGGGQLATSEKTAQDERKKKLIKYGIVGGVVVVAIILIVVLSVTLSGGDEPGPGPRPEPDVRDLPKPLINRTDLYSYTLTGDQTEQVQGMIFATDSALRDQPIATGINNEVIKKLKFRMYMTDFQTACLEVTDADKPRFSIPDFVVKKPKLHEAMRMEMLGFQMYPDTNNLEFGFHNLAKPDEWYVRTTQSSFMFMDKYMQIDFQLPSRRLFGLGERVREFNLNQGTWTMWARGADSPWDNGMGGLQVYGVHPFILIQTMNKNEYIGMFFRNANQQSPVIQWNENGPVFNNKTATLSYITTGGQIEVYFFIKGTAQWVISQYQNLVGKPTLPPFWAMGYSQGSWAYHNEAIYREVVANYSKADIPLETIWIDIEYMDKYATFTVDEQKFPTLKQFANELHANDQKIVLIIDAGISADDNSRGYKNVYYALGEKNGAFIKSTKYPGESIKLKVWPNETVFPDWFTTNGEARQVWKLGMHDLFRQVPYDGLWVDMNENTGFCDGECPLGKPKFEELQEKYQEVRFLESLNTESLKQAAPIMVNRSWYLTWNDQSQISTYHLPFIAVEKNPDFMAISLNATHAGGFKEYDVHSLNGLLSEANTYSIWKDKDFPLEEQRPFILSRSTFAGAGQFTSHWLGDNWRKWEYMRYSIAGIMNMNMFGIPHAGADVCGFFGRRDDELCARWTQLAAFYPFARNHYNRTFWPDPTEQSEPYVLSEKWQKKAKDAIYQRFEYLRMQYTCLFEASQFGKTCFDPTFFHIMNEDDISGDQYKNIEQNFILGNALLVSPVLEPNVTQYNSLFPKGVWVNMNNFSDIVRANFNNVTLSAETERGHAHLMEGTVIPWQPIRDYSIKKTKQLLKQRQLSLVLSRNAIGVAMGSVFIDEGNRARDLLDDVKNYEYYQLQHTSKTLNFIDAKETKKTLTAEETTNVYLEKLIIVNAEDLKETDFACYMDHFMNPTQLTLKYEPAEKTLNIWSPTGTLRFSYIREIHYGNSATEPNVCAQPAWTWKIKGDQPINLEQQAVTFNIVNQQVNSKQELIVNMKIRSNGIVNVNFSFAALAPTQRIPYVVKDVVLPDSSIIAKTLSQYVSMSAPGANFFFTVKNDAGNIYYDTREQAIILQENLVIHQTNLRTQPVPNFSGIYGLGQRISSFFLENGVYTMWNRDKPEGYDNGKTQGKNMYGTHPYYQGRSGPNQHFGVFSLNAAAQDWYIIQNPDDGVINVKNIAVGGIIDLYIFSDTTAELVTKKYHELVGRTIMPPLWSLGWHQCRWGYRNTSELIAVRTNYMTYDIPLDVLWSDIDYMDTYRDFTYNTDRFKQLPYLIDDQLHPNKQYFVPILDAGISYRPQSNILTKQNYPSFNEGIEKDVFMKIKGETFVGRVWPNEATFVDFDHTNANEYWADQLAMWRNKIRFDGLWLDMNEVANFCVGPCLKSQMLEQPSWSKLGYLPGHRNLEVQSTGLDVRHYDGSLELDQHSLYAFKEVRSTSEWLKKQELRPFIISRASFSGQHRFGGMWLGDNFSDLKFLEYSITGIMNMNMYGFTIAGSDICGFIMDTTPDLCLKWSVVGAFYPFSRNHNNFFEKSQEPYVFANDKDDRGISYTTMIRTAYIARYHLAKYMYTAIYRINQEGGTYFKPLFYEFGEDAKTYLDISNNIMLSSALKLSVLTNNLQLREYGFYFPQGVWCNIYNPSDKCFTQTVGGSKTLSQRLNEFWVHMREGYVVPTQDATFRETTRIMDLQDTPMELHILAAKNDDLNIYQAKGSYMNDDGVTLKTVQTQDFMNDYQFELNTVHQQVGPERTLKAINIDFSMRQRTVIFKNQCFTINRSDYLNKIFIYNVKGYNFFQGKIKATVTRMQGPVETYYTPNIKYDEATDRIVLDTLSDSNSLCMSTIVNIVIELDPTP